MLGLEQNLGNCVDRWRAVPSDTSHYIQKVIPLYGVEHSVKIWARCADRIVKPLVLNIHLWPKIYLGIYKFCRQ